MYFNIFSLAELIKLLGEETNLKVYEDKLNLECIKSVVVRNPNLNCTYFFLLSNCNFYIKESQDGKKLTSFGTFID